MQLFALGMHLYTEFDKSEEDYVCREKLFVSMVLMLSMMFVCASLRASALSDGHEAEPQVDTLNILGSGNQNFDSVADDADEDGSLAFLRRRHRGKVEGTLTYKKVGYTLPTICL